MNMLLTLRSSSLLFSKCYLSLNKSVTFFSTTTNTTTSTTNTTRSNTSTIRSNNISILKWSDPYIKKFIFLIHPDLYTNYNKNIISTNQLSLSRLNEIINYMKLINSNNIINIPNGSIPINTTLTFYYKSKEKDNSLQKFNIDFELPNNYNKSIILSRGYCNKFLLDLFKLINLNISSDIINVVELSIKSDLKINTSPKSTKKEDTTLKDMVDDLEAASFTAGSIYDDDIDVAEPAKKSYSMGGAKHNYNDYMNDFLMEFELDRAESYSIRNRAATKLINTMKNMRLIFFAEELTKEQQNIAIVSLSNLLLRNWNELKLSTWFGVPIMFACDYSLYRAPGFIVIPYKFVNKNVISFITKRAQTIINTKNEPLDLPKGANGVHTYNKTIQSIKPVSNSSNPLKNMPSTSVFKF